VNPKELYSIFQEIFPEALKNNISKSIIVIILLLVFITFIILTFRKLYLDNKTSYEELKNKSNSRKKDIEIFKEKYKDKSLLVVNTILDIQEKIKLRNIVDTKLKLQEFDKILRLEYIFYFNSFLELAKKNFDSKKEELDFIEDEILGFFEVLELYFDIANNNFVLTNIRTEQTIVEYSAIKPSLEILSYSLHKIENNVKSKIVLIITKLGYTIPKKKFQVIVKKFIT
jgi:hypothetical protein